MASETWRLPLYRQQDFVCSRRLTAGYLGLVEITLLELHQLVLLGSDYE